MKIYFNFWCIWFYSIRGGHADEITIDLSSSRDPGVMLNSGAKVKPLAGSHVGDSQDYRFENEDVHWLFPEGIEFRQGKCSSIFTAEQGRLIGGSGISNRIMPLHDAVAAAQSFINKLKPEAKKNAETKRLDEWYLLQRKKSQGDHFPDFATGIFSKRNGFEISVHIHASFNIKYPVTLNLDFGWQGDEDINPAAAPLNLNTGIIDLLPIGNKMYERAESRNPTGAKYDPIVEAWLKGDRSHPEEVQRLVDNYIQDARDRKTKATDPPLTPPEPKRTNYVHLIWIPFAALVWWLYRKFRRASHA